MEKARSKMLSRPVSVAEVVAGGKNVGSAIWGGGGLGVGEGWLLLRGGGEGFGGGDGCLTGGGGWRAELYGREEGRVGAQSILSSEGRKEAWA